MDMYRKMLQVFCLLFVLFLSGVPALASEIRIDGERVIMIDEEGNVLDSANPPRGEEIRLDGQAEIRDGGISIGTVRNNGSEQKNIIRETTLDNVIIINNGKTTVYKSNEERRTDSAERGK